MGVLVVDGSDVDVSLGDVDDDLTAGVQPRPCPHLLQSQDVFAVLEQVVPEDARNTCREQGRVYSLRDFTEYSTTRVEGMGSDRQLRRTGYDI